jgi:hypothetical protein
MTWRRWATIIILIATALALIGWDIYVAVVESGQGNDPAAGGTISEVILGFARSHPVVPFSFGVLMGHFFWPQGSKDG